MTRREQERLVGRYLGGELTGAEEQEFFIQVAVDNDLRQTLKAYNVVDSALHKHRETIPVQHPASRERMVTMLRQAAAMNPPQQQAAQYRRTGIVAIVGSWFNRRTAFASATTFIWMIAGFSAFALITGAVVVAPILTSSDEGAKPPAAVQRAAKPNGTSSAPATQKISEVPTATDITTDEQPTLRSDNQITTTETLPARTVGTQQKASNINALSQRRAIRTASQTDAATAQATTEAEAATTSQNPSTVERPRKDTINMRAKVKVLRP